MSEQTQRRIASECDRVKELLIRKNTQYGDSALSPTGVCAKGNAIDLIAVRIDDKLSRITRMGGLRDAMLKIKDEDVVQDLIGYLILAAIAGKSEVNNGG